MPRRDGHGTFRNILALGDGTFWNISAPLFFPCAERAKPQNPTARSPNNPRIVRALNPYRARRSPRLVESARKAR
jgi:hypothetical protein